MKDKNVRQEIYYTPNTHNFISLNLSIMLPNKFPEWHHDKFYFPYKTIVFFLKSDIFCFSLFEINIFVCYVE